MDLENSNKLGEKTSGECLANFLVNNPEIHGNFVENLLESKKKWNATAIFCKNRNELRKALEIWQK